MLGQPVSMLIPQVVGVRLSGKLPEGATATDLVLTLTEMLRKHGVVGKFVEYFGSGLQTLAPGRPRDHCATWRRSMARPAASSLSMKRRCATCGSRDAAKNTSRLVEAYCKEQGLFHTADTPEAEYSEVLELDLASVEPSVAGPKRPQDRVVLGEIGKSFETALPVAGTARHAKWAATAHHGQRSTAAARRVAQGSASRRRW